MQNQKIIHRDIKIIYDLLKFLKKLDFSLKDLLERDCFLCIEPINFEDFYNMNTFHTPIELFELWQNLEITLSCYKCYIKFDNKDKTTILRISDKK